MTLSPSFWKVSETKISDKVSHVTPLSELNEMVQYLMENELEVKQRFWTIECRLVIFNKSRVSGPLNPVKRRSIYRPVFQNVFLFS